jgi:hypothetical protein
MLDREIGVRGDDKALVHNLNAEALVRLEGVCQPSQGGDELVFAAIAFDVAFCHASLLQLGGDATG